MVSWLELLNLEIENIPVDNLIEPPDEVYSKEHFVATLDDASIQRLYALWFHYERSSLELMVAARYLRDSKNRDTTRAKIYELQAKTDLLKELFWTAIKDKYSLWGKSVGIRKGWAVVWFEPEKDDLPDFIRGVLGL